MGRVRKYKKIKAIDPFAKRASASLNSSKLSLYDQPPTQREELLEGGDQGLKKGKKRKKRDLDWDDEEDREKLLQIEAKRFLSQEKNKLSSEGSKAIQGRKEEESMKAFQSRVRQETKVTLIDQLKSMTKVAKKKKEWLLMKKEKKKKSNKTIKGKGDSEGGFEVTTLAT